MKAMAMGTESRAELTDSELGKIAKELRGIASGSSWSRTLSIGELVLKHFFRGRIDEWRTHRRQKDASIRRLAQRKDCPLAKSALSEAVAIYVARKDLPPFVEELTPSHVGLALRLPLVQRLEILRKAHTSGWSVRSMRTEVLSLKRRAGERRGRPRFSPARAAASHATRSLEALRATAELLAGARGADGEMLDALESALKALEQALSETRERMRALAKASVVPGLRGIVLASSAEPKLPKSQAG
jgi:hypothetical protein